MTLVVAVYRPQRQEPAPPGGVLRNSWRVGKRTVTIAQDVTMTSTPGVGCLRCEWSPNVPRKLRKAEMRQYKAGAAAHYQQVADIIGGNVVVAG